MHRYFSITIINFIISGLVFTLHSQLQLVEARNNASVEQEKAKYLILFIGDGMGQNHIQAANAFTAHTQIYQTWDSYWVSTYPDGGSYDPSSAWNNFDYVKSSYTDSAAAATALYTGSKTSSGRIGADPLGARLFSIAEHAHTLGMAAGAITSVQISHATPAAWGSHNLSRLNGYAIADEALWGNPNTTGEEIEPRYGGGLGETIPPLDVLIGGGHPTWSPSNGYVNELIRAELIAQNQIDTSFEFVERISGSPDGGARLLNSANKTAVTRLVGLFGGADGNIEYRMADGSGSNPENPTLAEMTQAALTILSRDTDGFTLLVEGGAIDWASHGNEPSNMDYMLGEMISFNEAIQVVIDWIDGPDSLATWDNTLVIITADHETGYLTAAPGIFADQPLGEISDRTIQLEKPFASTSLRASWEDEDDDSQIDPLEIIYWAWNTSSHTNSLVPLFARGRGSEIFNMYTLNTDPERGRYLDNTDVYKVMLQSLNGYLTSYFPLILQSQ